tara:strand:- start:290 stop:616 length:327 start_codon:yes stop_codon:yes gene_type:complete
MATLEEWKAQLKSDNPTLTKMVDGVSSQLNSTEYNATIDGWAQASYDKEVADAVEKDGGTHANYAEFRREAYGTIGDQLDMQYKDALNGTSTWKDHITAVKAKYQKPS